MNNEVYHWYGVWIYIPEPKMIALFESEKLALEFCNELLKSGIRWQVNLFDLKRHNHDSSHYELHLGRFFLLAS